MITEYDNNEPLSTQRIVDTRGPAVSMVRNLRRRKPKKIEIIPPGVIAPKKVRKEQKKTEEKKKKKKKEFYYGKDISVHASGTVTDLTSGKVIKHCLIRFGDNYSAYAKHGSFNLKIPSASYRVTILSFGKERHSEVIIIPAVANMTLNFLVPPVLTSDQTCISLSGGGQLVVQEHSHSEPSPQPVWIIPKCSADVTIKGANDKSIISVYQNNKPSYVLRPFPQSDWYVGFSSSTCPFTPNMTPFATL